MRTEGRRRLRFLLRWASAGALLLLLVAGSAFFRDIRRAYDRTADDHSSLIGSPYGDIEFTQGGSGVPVLVIHGSGGGYDQGELLAEALLGAGFRWVAPSRFGYLRSTYTSGATFDEQAHAYAHLLDYLGIERVAVLAMSHGGPSALLFAVLHPERVSSLTLVSAGVAASAEADQADANRKGELLVKIYNKDALYWGVTALFRKRFMELMGVSSDVIAGLTPAQRDLTRRIITYMNPAEPRSAGARFDNGAALPNERIEAIRAPTLIVHARDDLLQLFHNAEYAAAHVPGARLLAYDRGGHLLVVTEQASVRTAVQQHIRKSAGAAAGTHWH